MNKFIFAFIIFETLLHTQNILPVSYPVEPTVPVVKQPVSESTSGKEVIKNASENLKIAITAYLGSGNQINGIISLPSEIYFTHNKNGIIYKKKITPVDIAEITILEYVVKNSDEQGEVHFYEFEPSFFEIKMKNGLKFYPDQFFSFLKTFEIETVDGTTTLFTFFGDNFNKKTGWESKPGTVFSYHKKSGHINSVFKILFQAPSKQGGF